MQLCLYSSVGLNTFTLLLSVSLNLTSLSISWMESYIVFWLAHFTWLNVLMLKPVSEFPSILRLNALLLYIYISYFIYLLMDTWLASTFCLLWMMLLWMCVTYLFQSLLSNGLPLGSFDSVLWCTEVLNFDEVHFVHIFFCYQCLQYHLLEIIANPISWNFSVFSPRVL